MRPLALSLALIGLVMLTVVAFAGITRPRYPIRPIPYPIHFTGDSLTKGRSATLESLAYRPLVVAQTQAALGAHYGVYQAGNSAYASGWRASDALAALQAAGPRSDVRVFVVEIGTNDASGNIGASDPTDPATFATQYTAILDLLHTVAPSARLLCLSAWWDATLSIPYDTTIQSQCAAHGGTSLDLQPLYTTAAYHGPAGLDESWYCGGCVTDDFHPNNAGMQAIASLIEGAL